MAERAIAGEHGRPECPVRLRRARQVAYLVLVVLLALPRTAAMGQEPAEDPCGPPADKKLLKRLDAAVAMNNPTEKHQQLKALLDAYPDCAECLFRTGESAFHRARSGAGSFNAGIGYLEQYRQQCPRQHGELYYYLGSMYYAQERFAEAAEAFQQFLSLPGGDGQGGAAEHDARVAEVERILPELAFYRDFYRDKAPLAPSPLAGVDTPADEYLPMFSPDNELLFFTRISKRQALGDRFAREVEELTEARRSSLQADFGKGAPLPPPFNTGDSYGGVTVSLNNKELFVTVCRPVSAEYKNCDIYTTHYTTHVDFSTGQQTFTWSELNNLGPAINTADGWESQPSLSADGKTLFFATLRPASQGMDIYTSERNAKGEWSMAKPLPAPVNTVGDEKAPFMHSDSRTLYFAARPPRDEQGNEELGKGHRGIGGYDIFYSRLKEDGQWEQPKNLGNPINTPQDEHGLIVSADGRTAYFASSRFNGPGGLDIYGFNLPKEARPQEIVIMKGEVKNEAGKAVRDATVSITYMDTRKTEMLKVDPNDGKYAAVLRLQPGSDVIVTVKKPDHVFDSRSFSMEDTVRGGVAQVDLQLDKIETGRNYRVNDIRFATNSADITGASRYILEELITFLRENPKVRIELQGHTDNVGDLEANMVLSRSRAANVMQYLTGQGIAAERLGSQGFGPTVPIADNATEAGRALNRRTTFVITAH
ncbi:MAG: PD40 domain-containing protein [Flavobacteriales bacterium]|nr:PD40 domain-containing protein [Flavobacteriales bacterium]